MKKKIISRSEIETLKLISIQSKNLYPKQIKTICNLKKTYWKFNIKSQLNWFKKNVKSLDFHNCIYSKSKIIGYTLLRNRKIFVGKKKYNYFLIDSVIISPKERKKKLSYILMKHNNYIIKKKRRFGLLFCKPSFTSFYKKFSWKVFNIKKFEKYNFNDKLSCMIYNNNAKIDLKNKIKITI